MWAWRIIGDTGAAQHHTDAAAVYKKKSQPEICDAVVCVCVCCFARYHKKKFPPFLPLFLLGRWSLAGAQAGGSRQATQAYAGIRSLIHSVEFV